MPKPTLDIKSISDLPTRENFKSLDEYYRDNNHLVGFKFVEYTFTEAKSNVKIAHNLGYNPKDLILLSNRGPGVLTINYDNFDANYVDISSSGPTSFRAFVGTYWGSQ